MTPAGSTEPFSSWVIWPIFSSMVISASSASTRASTGWVASCQSTAAGSGVSATLGSGETVAVSQAADEQGEGDGDREPAPRCGSCLEVWTASVSRGSRTWLRARRPGGARCAVADARGPDGRVFVLPDPDDRSTLPRRAARRSRRRGRGCGRSWPPSTRRWSEASRSGPGSRARSSHRRRPRRVRSGRRGRPSDGPRGSAWRRRDTEAPARGRPPGRRPRGGCRGCGSPASIAGWRQTTPTSRSSRDDPRPALRCPSTTKNTRVRRSVARASSMCTGPLPPKPSLFMGPSRMPCAAGPRASHPGRLTR